MVSIMFFFSSVEKIWNEAKDIHKHVILLFENEESYIGREVLIKSVKQMVNNGTICTHV